MGMKKRPTIPRLDGSSQTILLVDDVGRTAEFYRDHLRLEPRDGDGERYLEFDTGDGASLLIIKREGSIAPMASVAAAGTPGTLTFAITPESYVAWKKWLTQRQVEIAQETKWIHGGRSLYVHDPDGRRIEFKAPAGSFSNDGKPAAEVAVAATKPAKSATTAPFKKASTTTAPFKKPGTAASFKKPAASEAPKPAPEKPAKDAGEAATAAPRINGVVESILYTDDLPRAVAFYRDALGLVAMTGDGQRFQAFDSGAGRVLLLFQRGATLEPLPAPVGMIPPHDGQGPQHIAFAIDAADYDRWRVRLPQQGITIESETAWDRGGRSVYFRDPDQHLVELVTPGIWPNY